MGKETLSVSGVGQIIRLQLIRHSISRRIIKTDKLSQVYIFTGIMEAVISGAIPIRICKQSGALILTERTRSQIEAEAAVELYFFVFDVMPGQKLPRIDRRLDKCRFRFLSSGFLRRGGGRGHSGVLPDQIRELHSSITSSGLT